MPVRNSHLTPPRKRLLMLLLAGSIGLSNASVRGEEFTPVKRGIVVQPAAGPLMQFRIARPFFKKSEEKPELLFRKPNLPLSPNIPKPPGMVPEVKESAATPAPAKPQSRQAVVAPKPQPRQATIAPKPQPQAVVAPKPQPPQRETQPSQTTNAQVPALSDDGWVARDAINQNRPLRDRSPNTIVPSSKSATGPLPTQPLAKPLAGKPKTTLVAPEASLPTTRVPSADVLPKGSVEDDRSLEELPADPATDAIRSLEPELASPGLNAPSLNGPETEANPTKDIHAAIERKSTSVDRPSESVQNDELEVRRPNIKATESVDRSASRPSGSASRPSSSASRQSSSASRPSGSASQYIGSEPRQADLDYTGHPAEKFAVSGRVLRMKPGIERVLQYFYDRPEIADKRSNWGMMHSIMVYGVDTRIVAGRKSYSAIGWIAGNNICRGKKLLIEDERGLNADSGVGLQGHQGQLLAVLSLCNVPAEYPLYANDTKYSVRDLIETEMAACKAGEELTFTLIGLAHYLDTDASWIAADGQRWDFERLIREELAQPIVGSACGGTHRLMGFAHALRKRRAEGRPITGQWARAHKFTADFVNYTYQLQNRDGSMSTRWFEGRADDDDTDRKIQTTGHMVEWLLTITPDSELQNPRLVAAVGYLLSAMHRDLAHDWQIGPKGHALRSLAMYHDRVYKSGTAWQNRSTARAGKSNTR